MSELIDNRAHRIRTLRSVIEGLHRGEAPAAVKDRLRGLVEAVSSTEIAAMEQELIAGGMPASEIQAMCDLHNEVLGEVLAAPTTALVAPPGHPIDTFRRENAALGEVAADLRQWLAISRQTGRPASAERFRALVSKIVETETHYRRKENLLFPCLERHGVTGPSTVMWGKHDEARELLKALDEAASSVAGLEMTELELLAETVVEPAVAAVEEMISKEERILLPMAADTLTEEEWAEIWRDTPRYGYCLAEPGDEWRPSAATPPENPVEVPRDGAVVFPTGALTFDQLRGLFGALPVDLTFVDAEDRVRYFSEGERIFDRSPAILGRKVHHCHPPSSVHVVTEILDSFRTGREDVAEFWIQLHGRFVHIRYFAVRGEDGSYLGTVEITQDLTRLRALEGERRLLQFEGAPS